MIKLKNILSEVMNTYQIQASLMSDRGVGITNILDQINQALARLMRGAMDEKREGIQFGKDPETGIELYNQSPDWVIRRDDGLGNFFELRLDQQYGYNVNMRQNDFEYYDYQLGDGQNEIDIIQNQ